MPPKLTLNVADKQQRRLLRARVGSLRDNRVNAKTLMRYRDATHRFLSWLEWMGLERPVDWEEMEKVLCDYLEAIWSEGESKGMANDTLSGAQHFLGSRRRVPGA